MGTMARTVIGVLLAAVVVGVPAVRADTYVVNSTADAVDAAIGNGTCATASGACTLRAAVQEANAHAGPDVISLPAGVYLLTLVGAGENLGATGDLDVTEALEVNGAGQATTIIDGVRADRIFEATGVFALRDLTLRNGAMTAGGAVFTLPPGAKTFERTLFTNNRADAGGAILHADGELTVTDSTFDRNVSPSGSGGAILASGSAAVAVTNGTFTQNLALGGAAGGLYVTTTGAVTVANSTFSENAASAGAAMLVTGASSLTITDSTIDGNVASGAYGGLLAATAGGGSIVFSGVRVVNNYASTFASLFLVGETVSMTGGEVSDNIAASAYAGLYATANTGLSVDGTNFLRNAGASGQGGGIFATLSTSGTLTLANTEIAENSAVTGGGAFLTSTGAISISRARVLNNGTSAAPGGGLYLAASQTIAITDSTVAGNIAPSVGGGLFTSSSMATSIQGCTISGNRAVGVSGLGGGGYFAFGAASSFANSTFSGNVADVQGGGIFSAGNLTARNLTLVDNDSPLGSAIFNSGGALTPISTIIAGAAPSHCAGAALVSGGNNIDSTGTCGLAGAGDQVVDPQLDPLADNGGLTLTHLPAPTSPALDTGAAAGCPATDQRGQTRPADGNGDGTSACDVGAVEFLDLCLDDPAKVEPGICGCGVPDTDANFANGTADCLMNGELKARIARAKTIIGGLAGDADPLEAELAALGESLPTYVSQYKAELQLTDPNAKVDKLAKKARKKIKKVGKAKAGTKLDKAKTKATTALDALDAAVAPQA